MGYKHLADAIEPGEKDTEVIPQAVFMLELFLQLRPLLIGVGSRDPEKSLQSLQADITMAAGDRSG